VPPSFFIDIFPSPVTAALVADNVITGQALDGIVAGTDPQTGGRLHQAVIRDNVTTDNLRDGIVLRLANSGNILRGSVAARNGRYGVYAQGATGNLFEANQMFGNGVLDARDEARESNTWIANQCATDFPAGHDLRRRLVRPWRDERAREPTGRSSRLNPRKREPRSRI
jgi:parallel beta-helix repeat protein